ncbi:TPA: hypothetical protein OUL15_003759 [Clostridioides difficile]|uniref:hypothetical protein n=8 Tax=Clostridioides difficile TaxID=1496 RepID=UPI00038D0178|nr:hypothetical protein [Clostridioides difficile]AUA29376.1 hypothetical protein CWR54_10035 [Clostridioides difficile]EGT4585044.1 hypothetical protein [Clostridioides difficile]EGT5082500.1 hypothetical protein [Clostridioides difficile]EGT5160622.1 hypothetical protein [Clostridioides difficile]EGT5454279.1 hypothetical protein [Clostridioides difficile]
MLKNRRKGNKKSNLHFKYIKLEFINLRELLKRLDDDMKKNFTTPILNLVQKINENFQMQFKEIINERFQMQFKEIISNINFKLEPILSNFKVTFNTYKINSYSAFFKNKNDLTNYFYNSNIFPPIKFFLENKEFDFKTDDLENFIFCKDIREFYLSQILKWKNKFHTTYMDSFIDSIHLSLYHENYIAICPSMFILLESLIRFECFPNQDNIPTKTICDKLKFEVFEKIDIDEFYHKFIKDSLYANTKKAEGLSRHSVHGIDLYKMDPLSAMNLIFLYDFIQSVIDIDIYSSYINQHN